jgi:hypothetical protein
MPEDDDVRMEQIARELRKAVRVSARIDGRIMRAVRHLPRHSRFGLWSRLITPRRVSVTPLSWGLLAAALALFAVLGGRRVYDDASDGARAGGELSAKAAKAELPQQVQFVLVAPDAKKVSLVGDFNGWDVSHAGYQAEHRGGGVWSVTASVPLGHHRYSFVVDDSVWVADPMAPRAADSDFGLPNSAIVVQNHE